MQILNITIHNFRSIPHSKLILGDYSLMVGANNSGKSNVMDALRIFYEKEIKFEFIRDFPKFSTQDKESWIEIEYTLSDNEYDSLKEEWKQSENRLKVRKYLQTQEKDSDGKTRLGIFAYNQEGKISDEHFYGAKNVQQGKLGDIIYIPAVSKLDEHTKLTGPSALRELLYDILKKLVKSSTAFSKLTSEFEIFSDNIKTEKTEDEKSLAGLERDITADIEEWDAVFELNINPVSESDIVKNLVSYKIIDKALNEKMEAEQFGQGFQRHLIFTLIRTAAKYAPVYVGGTKKEFKPSMTLLLFEEPEAFLHPIQQDILCRSLKTIGSQEGQQVFISSHSPHFVSHNSDDIPSIIRLCRDNNQTQTGQITKDNLVEIFAYNQQINNIVKDTCYEAEIDDLKEEIGKSQQLDESTVSELSKIYAVSKQVIMLRLHWLGYISKEKYEQFKKDGEAKAKGKRFGRRDWNKVFQNRVGNLVVRETANAYRIGKISYSEVMDVLSLNLKDTEKIIER